MTGLPLGDALNNLAPKSQNFFREIVFSECAEQWYVYVETAIPAFIELLITISIIDLQDIIRWRVVEELEERGREGRRRRGRHFRKPTVPDKTPDRTAWRQGTRTLIVLTGVIEKLGFIWLLYSAGDQFFYRWQSLIERFGECNPQFDPGYLRRQVVNGGTSILPEGQGFSMPILVQNTKGWASSDFSVSVPNGVFTVSIGLTIRGDLLDLPSVGVQLIVPGPAGGRVVRSGTIKLTAKQPGQVVASASFINVGGPGTGGIIWEMYGMTSATGVVIVDGSVFVQKRA